MKKVIRIHIQIFRIILKAATEHPTASDAIRLNESWTVGVDQSQLAD